jgi:hypothetical protein
VLWALLVQALRLLGRPREALPIQQMIVDSNPGNLEARFDLSEIQLLLGDFESGWRNYRYRYSLDHTTRIERKVQLPRWEGGRIEGRTLLIHDEQGYGDTFQFLRLVRLAKQRSGARVILQVNPESLDLARRSDLGADETISNGELPPPFQMHCELMSLPLALGLRSPTCPAWRLPTLLPIRSVWFAGGNAWPPCPAPSLRWRGPVGRLITTTQVDRSAWRAWPGWRCQG